MTPMDSQKIEVQYPYIDLIDKKSTNLLLENVSLIDSSLDNIR